MIPIGDIGVTRRTTPYVTYTLIGANVLVFLYELYLGGSLFFSDSVNVTRFFFQWGLIPTELAGGNELNEIRFAVGQLPDLRIVSVDVTSPISTWGTAFTSMFIHGGWMHILGNMLYLWVFGDNIEDRFGHTKFLLFYLGAGLAAVWTQVAFSLDSQTPMIGASGAISGVTGAYIVLFPFGRIRTLIIFFFITAIELPAILVLGFWFILQLFQGVGSIGALDGGVAYWAHLGGFISGMTVAGIYKLARGEPLLPSGPGQPRGRNPWDRFPDNYHR